MSLEKLIVISSNDKDSTSNSNSDFVVSLKESYYTQNIERIMIKDISLPNVFPNVRGPLNYGDGSNNLLSIDKQGVGILPVVVPEGQYVISTLGVPPANDLITVLTSLIDAVIAPDTVIITLDAITNKLNFTFSSANYKFVKNTTTTPSSLNDVLGIVNATPAYTNIINADGLPDLSGYPVVYVHSKKLAESNGIDGDFGLISLAEAVSLNDTPFGSYAYRQNNDDELSSIIYDNPRNLNRIQITLRDSKGNILDIGTFTMTVIFKAILSSG
jgi:hypothetical protein